MKVKLTKLNIYGFKSFAEKTQFIFNKNITGIVGPNGCGKSNIVDAIYWVFQNYGLKVIRANEKQDLIFKGNDIKPPAGFAEVELVFYVYKDDNIENIETENYDEEFSIRKRLYPSGEIIYYLNKKEVRPKDITEFLRNYSINSIEYSIIAQGSVSKIIDMTPEERTEMIESAAGIKNIKNERSKAFFELTKTEENLKSVSLLVEELENEVNKLKQQAEKTRIFKISNDNIIFAEQALQILKYRKIYESITKLQQEYEESSKNLKEFEDKISEIEKEKSLINVKIKDIENVIEGKKQSIYKFESEIAVIEKTILLSQKRYEELGLEKRRKIEDLNFFKNRVQKLDEILSFPIEEIKEELNQDLQKKDEIEIELSKINEKINDFNHKIEKNNNEIKKLEKQLKESYKEQEEFLNNEISTLFSNLYVARMKVSSIFSNSSNIKDLTNTQKTKLTGIRNRIEDIIKYGGSISSKETFSFIEQIRNEIENVINDYDGFLSKINISLNELKEIEGLLFGKDSIFTKFQQSNDIINELDEKIEYEKNNLSHLQQELESIFETRNIMIKRVEEVNKRIFQSEEKIKNYQINKTRSENEKVEIIYNIKQKEEELSQIENNMNKIKQESIDLIDKKDIIFSQKKEIDSQIREYEKQIDSFREELTKCYVKNESIIKEINALLSLRENFNISKVKYETQCESIRTNFYENYRIVLNEELINDEKYQSLKESELRNKIFEARKNLDEIGQVNFLALEEYEEVSKRYNFIKKQKEDILLTKERILELIEKLDISLKEKFIDAFNKINENFKNIFIEVFKGGNASMILTKPENIFETGIEIIIQPPGKNISNISLLSGGETAMSSISLLFAFFLYCPSPFCVMDEADAAFDENNVLLFKRLIQRFSKETQFFLISHNKLTLDIADILYGITMEQDGISKVVSVKLEDIKDTIS